LEISRLPLERSGGVFADMPRRMLSGDMFAFFAPSFAIHEQLDRQPVTVVARHVRARRSPSSSVT